MNKKRKIIRLMIPFRSQKKLNFPKSFNLFQSASLVEFKKCRCDNRRILRLF